MSKHFDKFFNMDRMEQEQILIKLLHCTSNHFDVFEDYRIKLKNKIIRTRQKVKK